MLEEIEQDGGAWRATGVIAVEQRPKVIPHPPDPCRSGPGLERVRVDDGRPLARGGVHLGGRGAADEADEVTGRDTGRQDIVTREDPRKLGAVDVEALGPRAV